MHSHEDDVETWFTKWHCTCCQQEIHGLGLQCVDCRNDNLRLCVPCFALGAEPAKHKSNHKCRYFDCGSLVIKFAPESWNLLTNRTVVENSPKWSAREEIKLLYAIDRYGFGNWQDISKYIETKSPSEAKFHYENAYIAGVIGELTWSTFPNEANRGIINVEIQKPVDHTAPCDDVLSSPKLAQRLPRLEITPDEMHQLGYMPKRDDYEKEYDDEAEKLVSELSFSADDDEVDVGLKLAVIDIYNRRLGEREKRKRMARQYQLMEKFFKDKSVNTENKTTNTNPFKDSCNGRFTSFEKSLQETFRPFVQFENSRDMEQLIRNLVKEQELKHRLNKLHEYSSNGVTRIKDCSKYERMKANVAILEADQDDIDEMEVLLPETITNSLLQKEERIAAEVAAVFPGADLLTDQELQLCSKAKLSPAQFLTVKTAVLLACKPNTDNQPAMLLNEIPRPSDIEGPEWELLITFFNMQLSNSF